MIYYTADLHFGYESIIEQTSRPFPSVKEMDKILINNWNAVVSDNDTVYVIGDIGGHCTSFPAEQLSKLRGHKHLIRGNHDACLSTQDRFFHFFESVTDFLEIDDGEFHITLCHYPLVYIQGGYMIHGHIHNTKKEIYQILTQLPKVMNAGVDINAFRPVTLDELIKHNRDYYKNSPRSIQRKQLETLSYKKQKWKAEFHPLPLKK